MPSPISTDPLHLAVSKSKGITIDWADGHVSRYSNEYLRDHCPCASCTGAHGRPPQRTQLSEPFPMYTPKLRMTDVEEVGSYALRIIWSDGHSTGIYSWDHLRHICPCDICRPNP